MDGADQTRLYLVTSEINDRMLCRCVISDK